MSDTDTMATCNTGNLDLGLSDILSSADLQILDTVNTVTLGGSMDDYTITSGPLISISPNTYPTGAGLTWNDTITLGPQNLDIGSDGKMSLTGDQADIEINGVSLLDTLKGIQDRLNILRPNTKLEEEWDQLHELGEQYRKLETQLLEKQKAWTALKS